MNLRRRATEPERMDDLHCHGEVVHQTLRELDIINRRLGGNAVTLDGLATLLRNYPASREVVIFDMGCGSGTLLKQMAQWGRRHKRNLRLVGCDANPHIAAYAKQHTRDYPEIEILTANIFDAATFDRPADVITATLVLHHFSDDELVYLLRLFAQRARVGVVINDLHRHALAYYAIRAITRLFSRSAMVQFDAPLSVARAFRKSEWRHLLAQAAVTRYRIRWRWAFRWQVVIQNEAAG